MKILQLLNRFPYPAKDGYTIAAYNMAKGFAQRAINIDMLIMNTERHFADISALPEELKSIGNIHTVYVDNSISYKGAFLNLLGKKSYNISRFESVGFEKKLTELLSQNNYDIVQLEGLNLCLYIEAIRKYSKAKVILRAHNAEHRIWERTAEAEMSPVRKWYLNILAKRLKKFESERINKVEALVAISPEDAGIFKLSGCKKPIHISPAGTYINRSAYSHIKPEFPSLFHIGALNWMPNQLGLMWFLENVWNSVSKKFPELKFYIAGRYTPSWFFKLRYNNVEILGEVDDAYQFMASKALMIVPLKSGSGMRVKIIEGMALGKTIISTPVGAEGIDFKENKNILIARSADDFEALIGMCINDEGLCNSLGENASKLAVEKYANASIIAELLSFYNNL